VISRLHAWAVERSWRLACGGRDVLDEACADLEGQRSSGELDANFYAGNLSFFRYEDSSETIHFRSHSSLALRNCHAQALNPRKARTTCSSDCPRMRS
jgi:hypothetical protein